MSGTCHNCGEPPDDVCWNACDNCGEPTCSHCGHSEVNPDRFIELPRTPNSRIYAFNWFCYACRPDLKRIEGAQVEKEEREVSKPRTKAQLEVEIHCLKLDLNNDEEQVHLLAAEADRAHAELKKVRTDYNALLEDAQAVAEQYRELYDTCDMEQDVAKGLALSCFDEGSTAERFAHLYDRLIVLADELEPGSSDLVAVARRIAGRKKWESGE